MIQDENLLRAENEDKITPYFLFLISIAAVAGFLFGYGGFYLSNASRINSNKHQHTDTAIIGSALPMVGTDLGHLLSAQEEEIITASCTIGAIFGASILGTYADKLGRRWAMIIADVA